MLRHHGDIYLTADRKNRVERSRLDKQLRGLDRDLARHEFFIERQKKAVVTKWRGVSMTTGHSEKALPPDGPRDNVYENCRYKTSKLSEKRLMEWKAHERQLEKFLRQFQHRPSTRPTTTATVAKPRPSSSRLERTSKQVDGEDGPGARPTAAGRERIRSAKAVLQSDHGASTKRCASAVSFSSKAEVFSIGDETDRVSLAEDEHGLENIDENGNADKPSTRGSATVRSGLRSLCTASLHYPYPDLLRKGSPSPRPRSCAESPTSDILEGSLNPPLGTTLSAVQKLKHEVKNYDAFVRTRVTAGTKFFVTKNSVVMTNTEQHTCKEFSVADSPAEGTETETKALDGPSVDARKASKPLSAVKMSVSSLSSDDTADNVFLPSTDSMCVEDNVAGFDTEATSRKHNAEEVASKPEDSTETNTDTRQRAASSQPNFNGSTGKRAADCQSTLAAPASEDFGKSAEQPAGHPLSSSRPAKKLSISESEKQSSAMFSSRRRSSQPVPQNKPASSDQGHGGSASHLTLLVGKEGSERLTKTLLTRRRQSNAAVLSNNHPPAAKPNQSSIMAAMTVTPLLRKEEETPPQRPANRFVPPASQTRRQHDRSNSLSDTSNVGSVTQQNNGASPLPRNASHSPEEEDDDEVISNGENRPPTQWRRDLALEQPAGLSPSVSSLGTVIKAAMVFSKAARKRALSTMVEENNVDKREVIRKERLRTLQSRASVLSKIMSQFPVNEDQ